MWDVLLLMEDGPDSRRAFGMRHPYRQAVRDSARSTSGTLWACSAPRDVPQEANAPPKDAAGRVSATTNGEGERDVRSGRGDEALSLGQRLARLRRQIAAAESALVEREAELADLRVEVASFELRYETLVGRKLAALEEVEASIAACRKQIQGFRRWGRGGPPTGWDGETYVPVDEQYRRTWRDPAPPGPSFTPPAELATQSAARQDLRALYRQLCRRFHPDLTQDPVERAWRTEMMAAINAAYAAQSRAELQALAATPYRGTVHGAAQEAGRETLDGERLGALQDRLSYLSRKLRQVEGEIDTLTHSPLVEMRLEVTLAARQGQDLLGEMAQEVERDLARKQAELDYLCAQLRALGMEDGP